MDIRSPCSHSFYLSEIWRELQRTFRAPRPKFEWRLLFLVMLWLISTNWSYIISLPIQTSVHKYLIEAFSSEYPLSFYVLINELTNSMFKGIQIYPPQAKEVQPFFSQTFFLFFLRLIWFLFFEFFKKIFIGDDMITGRDNIPFKPISGTIDLSSIIFFFREF